MTRPRNRRRRQPKSRIETIPRLTIPTDPGIPRVEGLASMRLVDDLLKSVPPKHLF